MKTSLILLTAFLSTLLLASCQKSPDNTGASTTKKILRIGNGTEPQELDPHIVTGVPEHKIITAILEGLVTESINGPIEPATAESWTISPDGLTYTFKIRKTARWSNGDPVTSTDFARSIQRILTPTLAAEYAYRLFILQGAEAYYNGNSTDFSTVGVSTPDARTLVLKLNHPVPYFLESLKHYAWFPVHIPTLEKFGALDKKGTPWTRPGNFIGNGPFNLSEWRPNQKIIVTKSPTYWDADTTKLDAIEFFAIDNPDAEERLFRTGQLDLLYSLPLSKIATYRKNHPNLYHQDPYYGIYYYRFNTTRPPLNDVRVRRAIALAIDRDAIVNNILRAGQTPALNFTPPSPDFQSTAQLTGNITDAQKLLAEAGYPDGKNFPTLRILYNTLDSHRVIAEAIQQMLLKKLGIKIELVNQEWQTYLVTTRNLDYDLSRAGWIGDFTDPAAFLDILLSNSGNNQTGWKNKLYDQLYAQSQKTTAPAARRHLYQQLDQLITDDLPILPLYFYTRVYALNPRVQNWIPTPLDTRSWKYIDLN